MRVPDSERQQRAFVAGVASGQVHLVAYWCEVATQARLSLPAGLRQSAPKSTIEPQLPAPKETCTRPAALSEQTGRSQRRQALQQWQVSAARTAPCSLASGRPQPSCASSSCPAAISSRSCRVGFRRGRRRKGAAAIRPIVIRRRRRQEGATAAAAAEAALLPSTSFPHCHVWPSWPGEKNARLFFCLSGWKGSSSEKKD
jgi:hypothetical protein